MKTYSNSSHIKIFKKTGEYNLSTVDFKPLNLCVVMRKEVCFLINMINQ